MRPALSVVLPLHNEAEALPELLRRCHVGAAGTGAHYEICLVDDASTDQTAALAAAAEVSDARVRHVRLDENMGQFGATQAGLRAALGERVVVLDGDLQDPPELIEALWRTAEVEQCSLVYAVKAEREAGVVEGLGLWVYHALQTVFGGAAFVPGAGSYCLMSAALAEKVAALDARHLNLAAALGALERSYATVSYAKAERAHGVSRVGPLGLAAEAYGSLRQTGALGRLALSLLAALLFLGAGLLVAPAPAAYGAVALFAALLWRRAIIVPLLVAAAWGGLCAFVVPRVLPLDFITPLQEGDGIHVVRTVLGEGVHSGPAHRWLAGLLGLGTVDLWALVTTNVWLGGLLLWAAWRLARQRLGSAGGAWLAVLVFAATPLFTLTLRSELPSLLISLSVLVAVFAAPHLERPAAFGLLGALAVLLVLTRSEWALAGAVALPTALWLRMAPDEDDGFWRWLRRRFPNARSRALPAVILLAASVPLGLGGRANWVAEGLRPLNPSIATLPVLLADLMSPTVAVLLLFGLLLALRKPLVWLGLPIIVVLLYRTCFAAGHSHFYEMQRYASMFLGPIFVLGLSGGVWLREQFGGGKWVLALLLACLLPGPGFSHDLFYGAPADAERWSLRGSEQVEARFLLEVLGAHPECRIFTPARDGSLLGFGQPEGAQCELLYTGLHCNRVDEADCGVLSIGLERIAHRTFADRPYSDESEYGRHRSAVILALYRRL